jgi:hypothetical protein
MEQLKTNETKNLMLRVYNSKKIADKEQVNKDYDDIKALCNKVFGDGSVTPDPSLLHQFNNIIVQAADEIARPMATDMLGLLADFRTAKPGDIYAYTIPQNHRATIKFAANGTGTDLTRVEGGKKTVAVPQAMQTGFYYEPLSFVQDSVDEFNLLINDIANAKIRLYWKQISKVFQAAISSTKIPATNVKTGSGLVLADLDKIAGVIQRVGYGGRPVLVADSLFIDYFAGLMVADATKSKLLTDGVKEELLSALNITQLGKITAVNLINPFIDESNTKVELPVNEGYMFSGTATTKPLVIVEYGNMRQFTEQNPEDERIKMMLKQDCAIEMVVGQNVGYLRDSSIIL